MIEQLSWDPIVHRHGAYRAAQIEQDRSAAESPTVVATGNVTPSGSASDIGKAREAFTAMVLQSFLDAAVPKNISGAGRAGAANTMWRSLLVEQLAKTVAASGQFDVLGGADDARLVGTVGAVPAPAGHLIQGKGDVNEPD